LKAGSSGNWYSMKPSFPPPAKPEIVSTPEQLPTIIQGQVAGSKEEARVAVALDYLKFEYKYQYQLFGGRNVRGGQVLDFLVLVAPKPVPLFVNGRYWHGTNQHGKEDELKLAAVEAIQGFDVPLVWWDDELTSVDDAISMARKDLGAA